MDNLEILLLAAGIAASPISVSAYILLLQSRRGTTKGWGFLAGWLVCLIIVVGGTLLLTGGRPPKPASTPSTVAAVIRVVAGIALLVLALLQWRGRGTPKKEPRWKSGLDRMGPVSAAVIAILLAPWTLMVAAGAAVSGVDISQTESIVVLVLFCVLAAASYAVMQVGAMLRPEATRARLERLDAWITRHTTTIIVVACVVLGVLLVVTGLMLLF